MDFSVVMSEDTFVSGGTVCITSSWFILLVELVLVLLIKHGCIFDVKLFSRINRFLISLHFFLFLRIFPNFLEPFPVITKKAL